MGDSPTERQDLSPEKWLISSVRGAKRDLVRTVAWAFAAGLVILLQARLLALACHRLVIEKSTLDAVLPLAGLVAGLALLRGLFLFLSERRAAAAASSVKREVRTRLYRRLQLLGPAGRAGEETGPLVEAVTTGVEGLEPYVARFLPHAALAALLPPVVLLVVLPAEWRAGIVLLFSAPFIPLFMVLIGRGSESLNRKQWDKLGRMAGHLLDMIQGLPDLRICGAAKREAAAVARVAEEYRHSTMTVLRVAFLSAFTLEFFSTVGTAVVAVAVGFRLLYGNLSLLDGLFVLLLAPEFYLPFRTLGLSYHARMQGLAAAERIAPLLTAAPAGEGDGAVPVPPGPPDFRFEGVTFRYGGRRGGVEGVDLHLPAGSVTALVGESGSGKTTLARLLLGLARPEGGRITVNGVNLAQSTGADWRARIAWVAQHPFIFSGSLRDNLLLGAPSASDAGIRAALEAAAAAGFVDRMPAGLDTVLGDRGAGLSGGELRRLALARAFLRNADLVVLDEPTAGLDPDNERLVAESLRRLAVGRTMLVISHREGTVQGADRVAVMAAGRVVQVVDAERFLAGEAACLS
jgi:ATP-binding cassette, subfamily C, bacterial CydD